MTAALTLTAVSKRYGNTIALDDVSLEAMSGEVHAVVGENGAGKSTLIGIAAGATLPDSGSVAIGGTKIEHLDPWASRELGLALVSQHPALLPDLSVLENLLLVRRSKDWPRRSKRKAWAREILATMNADIDVDITVSMLSPAQRALVEISRALSLNPKVLILDEPTEALVERDVRLLFDRVRGLAKQGTAVVYISHRIPEIMQIADRVTVLRDGRRAGPPVDVGSVDEQAIVSMIVGREFETRVQKIASTVSDDAELVLEVNGLSSEPNLAPTSVAVRSGEILGLAGITGNGQQSFIRSLAGLQSSRGEVRISGKKVRLQHASRSSAAGIAYVPGDRQVEGVFPTVSVKKNIGLGGFRKNSLAGVIIPGREKASVAGAVDALDIKTAGPDALVSSLSGGNQQKVVFARVLETKPKVLLADEPTSGVDVGARSEIYDILRTSAENGVGVVVLSTDAPELEYLCDRVLVFSRGHVTCELAGDEVRSERISEELVMSTQLRSSGEEKTQSRVAALFSNVFNSFYGPLIALVALMFLLAFVGWSANSNFISPVNLTSILLSWAALASISYGQQLAVLLGGIDLSVGPLAGLVAVVGSFFFGSATDTVAILLGIAAMIGTVLLVGLFHSIMISKFAISAVGISLASFVAIQGVSRQLRQTPSGVVDPTLSDIVLYQVSWVPVAAIVIFVVGLALEFWLRFTRLGTEVRALGSNEVVAKVLGVRSNLVITAAFTGCSLLTLGGGVLLLFRAGIGDASQGIEFTMVTIVAVVLGGAALAGGRGSFLGVMIGALLLQQAVALAPFMHLSQAWNTWFPAILLVLAGLAYGVSTRSRERRSRLAE